MKNEQNPKTIDDFFAQADVHDLNREKNGGLITCLVSFVVLAVETLLVYWAVMSNLSATFVLVLHGAVVVLLALYTRVLMSRGEENRFALLLLMTTATTGPFGPAGVILTVMLYFLFMRRAVSFEEWYETIFPTLFMSRSQRIYDDIVVGRDESSKNYSVIPFLDVLSFGNEQQKRQALAKMTSNFHPNFSPAFRKALLDDSNSIRVQAATAISKIENQFMERLIKLTELKERFPREPVVVMALAEHYDNYAYTGLLDADRERGNRQKALDHYLEYLELDPTKLEVRTHVGRILMRSKEYAKAADWFRKCADLGYRSDAMSQWQAEALFECKRYDELRRLSGNLRSDNATSASAQPLVVKEALGVWASAGGQA
jgi:hypothetical protein